jgi:outer membrane protein
MKKLALYLIPLVLANTVAAQTKVGLIDISRAVLSTAEGKSDLEALDKKFEPRRTELLKQSTDLQVLQKQVADGGAKLSDDARAELMKSIEHKQLDLQHAAENAQTEYNRERAEIIGRVLKKMAPVIDKYGRDNGYTMIFDAQFWPAGPVLWASGPTADITGAVVAAYNTQAPSSAPAQAPSGSPSASPRQ